MNGILRRTKRRFGQQLLLRGGSALAIRRYRSAFAPVAGSPAPGDHAPTLVALNPARYRGELEVLAANGFRVLRAPYELQTRLLGLYFEGGDDVLAASRDRMLSARRRNLRSALRSILAPLYRELGVDATIGAALHYKQDLDWGAVSDALGYPYIVLHRENLAASRSIVEMYQARARRLDPFAGTLVTFHNEVMRTIFVEGGYVPADRAAVTGAFRMDDLAARLPIAPPPQARKQVALFSFGPGAGISHSTPPHWPHAPEKYLWELCVETHVAVGEFARDNPDVDVVVKPKWGGAWIDNLNRLYAARGIDPASLANFSITTDIDAQALIETSHVVIGFASTTLLEAAVMGRPVIVPWFAEAADPQWQDHLMFRDERDIFDCANSPGELTALIAQRLRQPVIDPQIAERRRQMFADYVAPLDGSATARTVTAIGKLIDAARDERRHPKTIDLPIGSQQAA